MKTGKADLFRPHSNMILFGSFINNISFLIAMYLKNILNSNFLSGINDSKITEIVTFIEELYKSMDEKYYKDIIEYIILKYKIEPFHNNS